MLYVHVCTGAVWLGMWRGQRLFYYVIPQQPSILPPPPTTGVSGVFLHGYWEQGLDGGGLILQALHQWSHLPTQLLVKHLSGMNGSGLYF